MIQTLIKFTHEGIALIGLPLPPTQNKQYKPIPFYRDAKKITARLISTQILENYKTEMRSWYLSNLREFQQAQEQLMKLTIRSKKLIKIDRYFGFFESTIVAKSHGGPKRLDITNRIKAFDDALCDMLAIDDKYIWKGTEEKCVVQPNSYEHVTVVLSAFIPRTMGTVVDEILQR